MIKNKNSLKVSLSSKDFAKLKCDDVDKLFMKDSKLKKPVGLAAKGWKLVMIKGSTDDATTALENAKKRMKDMMTGMDGTSSCTFLFSRRTGWW